MGLFGAFIAVMIVIGVVATVGAFVAWRKSKKPASVNKGGGKGNDDVQRF